MSKIKTILVFEKPSQAQRFMESVNYNEITKDREIYIHYAHCVVPYLKFKYPKNLKYKEYPVVQNINYKLVADKYIDTEYGSSYKNLSKDFLSSFEDIIFSVDMDKSGAYCANQEMIYALGENYRTNFKKIYVMDINNRNFEDDIKKSMTSEEHRLERISKFDKLIEEGSVKKYFDYNYQTNANIFIKELYFSIFEQDEELYSKHGLSKFMVQTIFLIQSRIEKKQSVLWSNVLAEMQRNKGTGKYNFEDGYYSIGSPASTAYILENLKKLNIINYTNDKGISFTKKGLIFKELLHKKLNDPDLHIRIENWCKNGINSLSLINKYIISVFQAQKRKNKYLQKES